MRPNPIFRTNPQRRSLLGISMRAALVLLLVTVLGSQLVFSPRAFTSGSERAVIALTKTVSTRSEFPETKFSQNIEDQTKPGTSNDFVIYTRLDGVTVCRDATQGESRELDRINPSTQGLHPINHLAGEQNTTGPNSASGLTIVLRATQQLENSPEAKAAFIRSAATWEAQIKSPITIYIDADYGLTNFGSQWPAGVLGSTRSRTTVSYYGGVRANLIASASNAGEIALYSSLPSNTVPTDLGNASSMTVSTSIGRAIGLIPAVANPGDPAAMIGFNSNFQFDFDRSDGIASNKTDFEAVATHEIGHVLGFTSDSGASGAPPRLEAWDLFRFRPSATSIPSAARVMTNGGAQVYSTGGSELGLSTGGPSGQGSGGDGRQSSHWKDDSVTFVYIGIMDPTIPNGQREDVTQSDLTVLNSLGYNFDNSSAPPGPPAPPAAPSNNDFASSQTITGCTGTVGGPPNIGANKETGEPSHSPDSNAGGASVWYQWQAPGSGTVTITTAGSNFDTLLGVYTGNIVGSLTALAKNDDSGGGLSSSVTFTAVGGTIYRVAVDGFDGDQGDITLNWTGCQTPTIGGDLVISQIYAGGGTAGATYRNSYIEILNRGNTTISLNNWKFQLGSSTGTFSATFSFVNNTTGLPIQPGQHMLIRLGSGGASGATVPADLDASAVNISLSGKIAITKPGTAILSGTCPLPDSNIVDFVGYGSTTNCFEGSGPAPTLSNTTAAIRLANGCTDTDNNATDFSAGAPSPRNGSSPATPCTFKSKKTGVFRPSTGELFLKNANSSGFADTYIIFGNPGDYPLAGDWNGDGADSVGIYRSGAFYLRNTNSTGFADIVLTFGNPGDQPIAGDWNGDGVDTIGVYRNGTFLLRNSNTAGPPDLVFTLGNPGDVGIAGDWNGDGVVTCGVFRPSNGIVYLRNSNTTGFADLSFVFGNAGDKPVAGDWNADGLDTIGIYREGVFYLSNSNSTGFADIVFVLGNSGDFPIAGNWNGTP